MQEGQLTDRTGVVDQRERADMKSGRFGSAGLRVRSLRFNGFHGGMEWRRVSRSIAF